VRNLIQELEVSLLHTSKSTLTIIYPNTGTLQGVPFFVPLQQLLRKKYKQEKGQEKSDDPLRQPLLKPLIGISGFKVKKIVFRITATKVCI